MEWHLKQDAALESTSEVLSIIFYIMYMNCDLSKISNKYYNNYDSNYKTYAYDAFGRITSFSDSLGLSAMYTYYSDGLRKSKTVGSDTLTYYYNGDDIINESKNGSDTINYLMGVDGYICRRRAGQYK